MSEGPFRRLRGIVLVAAAYGLAATVWIVAVGRLPGGRWMAVHLFTLGVLTNLVVGLSDRFARALTHSGGTAPWWQPVLANLGVAAVLWGIPSGQPWGVAGGATVLTGVVLLSYARLRRRRAAVQRRFAWVVRMYERAHGAFVHGAVLGVLVGTGVLPGSWHLAARAAHLHVNLLGWGGLTLLATMVFLGPAMARSHIEKDADPRAARALRWGATGLAMAVLALLGTGVGGAAGTALRIVAAAGLAIYARGVTVVCLPVLRAAWRGRPSVGRWSILATTAWFQLVAWGDVVAVAAGADRLLEAVGVGMLVGVLAQGILAALGHFAPLLRGAGPSREAARNRLPRLAGPQALAWNAGAVLVVVAAALGPSAGEVGAWLARAGCDSLQSSRKKAR